MGDWGPASNVYRHLLWILSIIIIILSSKELLHFIVKAPVSGAPLIFPTASEIDREAIYDRHDGGLAKCWTVLILLLHIKYFIRLVASQSL